MQYTAIIEDVIDVDGQLPLEAARQMWTNMRTFGGPIMTLVDENGHRLEVDLGHVGDDGDAELDQVLDWFDSTGRLPYVPTAETDGR